MRRIIDHIGRTITIPDKPQRIVSLCPAITATLLELGATEEVIGRTEYCIFPQEIVEDIVTVGGTKQVNYETIHALKPDLIIAEKEENTKVMVNTLAKTYPVFVFEVQTLDQNERLIEDVGQLVHRQHEAHNMLTQVRENITYLPNLDGAKGAYMIWQEPYMVVGHDTFITSILTGMNIENPFITEKSRYPIIHFEELLNAELDFLLLASEPFPFTKEHQAFFQERLPHTTVLNVDGEMFWYGSQSIVGYRYMPTIFN